jgi:hypothetical protein
MRYVTQKDMAGPLNTHIASLKHLPLTLTPCLRRGRPSHPIVAPPLSNVLLSGHRSKMWWGGWGAPYKHTMAGLLRPSRCVLISYEHDRAPLTVDWARCHNDRPPPQGVGRASVEVYGLTTSTWVKTEVQGGIGVSDASINP